MNSIRRVHQLPDGGKITVTVSSPDPINESEYLLLRPQAAKEAALCLMDLANAFRPVGD